MITISLPDGSKRQYSPGITGLEIAENIGARLAKDAVAIRLDGALKDLTLPLLKDAAIEIITRKSDEGLELLRHDAAHAMAEAVKELYPETQVTIGPAIENGFYYDFFRDAPFTPEDLEKIEARMHEIVDRDESISRDVWTRDQAIKFFQGQGERFKAEIIESIPGDEDLSVYKQGNFLDLCRGPHLPSTSRLGHAFKLMKLAGAYWRGDAKNPQLQRIYGTAWADDAQLKAYLTMLEEAEKRDHRRLGREMRLFHQQEEAPGAVFWHPRGWQLYRTLQDYMRGRFLENEYIEVHTPQLVDRRLWERSGHWEKFRDDIFVFGEDEERAQVLKPMNCPCHIEIFKQGIKSYRDLPIRMAEFGSCHRNEPSGALHGIMRVRAFVQDDAHIFCAPDQLVDEARRFCRMLKLVYKDLGFDDIAVKFSDRPPVRVGADAIWDKAEEALRQVAKASGLPYKLNPGQGAFYGPKLEFVLKDAIGRDWQCGTFQVDFILPERLDAHYIGEDGEKHRPVMLHRAIFGSLERFIGVLLEHYAGRFPVWLAPLQVVIAPITNEFDKYAHEVAHLLREHGIRVEVDDRNEKIGYKIRDISLQKIPIILVAGKREEDERTITVRRLGSDAQETLALEAAIDKLRSETQGPLEGPLLKL